MMSGRTRGSGKQRAGDETRGRAAGVHSILELWEGAETAVESIVARNLVPWRGCRVLVRFDDGTWYGGRVTGWSFYPASELTILYDDGSPDRGYPDLPSSSRRRGNQRKL